MSEPMGDYRALNPDTSMRRWIVPFLFFFGLALLPCCAVLLPIREMGIDRRMISMNKLKQIAFAMHSYQEQHGTLPPPAIYDKEGQPLLSWRVLLLPYLEDAIQFRLDERWDSETNLRLLHAAPVPYVYAVPEKVQVEHSYMTPYQVIVGQGAAFEPGIGIALDDFPDGLGQTVLVVETAEMVPWTKPQDLRYASNAPLPKVGGLFTTGFNVVFADGAVRPLKNGLEPKALRAIITRNGGDGPIELYELE